MKLYLLAFSALCMIPASAIAADALAPAAPNWSGFYAGAQIGSGSVNSRLSGFDQNGSSGGGDNDGAWGPLAFPYGGTVVGGFVGYNEQLDRIVIGIEADANKPFGASSGGNITEDLYPGPGGMFSVQSKWDASIRARFGVLLNERTLAYGTGGIAFGAFDAFGGEEKTKSSYYETYSNWGAGTNIGGGTRVGYTVGGGLEYALDNNWKIRGEYRYTDFGTARTNYIYDPLGANTPGYVDHQISENRFMVGASYAFSGEPTKSLGSSNSDGHDWSGFHIGSQIGISSSTTQFSGFDQNGQIGGGDNNGAWSLADL